MINTTPAQMLTKHVEHAIYVYGEDYKTNPTYINSQFKQLFETQYYQLLSFFN
jgi:uncharacterized phage-like protein YoqJ